jgi:hypothetical protein
VVFACLEVEWQKIDDAIDLTNLAQSTLAKPKSIRLTKIPWTKAQKYAAFEDVEVNT